MPQWLKSLFSRPEPAGPPETIRTFSVAERTVAQDGVRVDGDSLRIDSPAGRTVRLYEVGDPGLQQCVVTYRAELRSEAVEGRAFLEMWCRIPGRGEFFSKGLHDTVSGTTGWASYEVPFRFEKGEAPDLIKLNLVMEGPGVLWLRNIRLLRTPLA